jgi:endonuclease YncB( thermonuclease family)
MRITYIILGSVAAVVALVAAAAFLPKFTGPRSDIPISAADIGVTDGDTIKVRGVPYRLEAIADTLENGM